ncbi:MAG: LuxR C-terminal-related transcriptional regulator [Chloroflexota bacterium]
MPNYVPRLLSAFGPSTTRATKSQSLADPLSKRERDVLRSLATDLNGPEIARKLIISLSTMRTQAQNIYSKLDINNRCAVVRRAEKLGLL